MAGSGTRIAVAAIVVAALAALAYPAPGAVADERRAYRAALGETRAVEFDVRGLKPLTVKRALVRVGRYERRIGVRSVRRSIRRGKRMRVRLPARVARRARQSRARVKLLLRTRYLPEFDGFSATGGTLRTTGARSYQGSLGYEATNDGGDSLSFARSWDNVRWGPGTDIWYGAAFYIPRSAAGGYANLLRWDNYLTYEGDGDVGGIELSEGALSLTRSDYDGGNYSRLVDRFSFPRDRWFWLEIRQRFAAIPALAVSEVYLNDRRVGLSLAANSRGRRIDDVRVGYVYVEGPASKIYFDRFKVSTARIGPYHR